MEVSILVVLSFYANPKTPQSLWNSLCKESKEPDTTAWQVKACIELLAIWAIWKTDACINSTAMNINTSEVLIRNLQRIRYPEVFNANQVQPQNVTNKCSLILAINICLRRRIVLRRCVITPTNPAWLYYSFKLFGSSN